MKYMWHRQLVAYSVSIFLFILSNLISVFIQCANCPSLKVLPNLLLQVGNDHVNYIGQRDDRCKPTKLGFIRRVLLTESLEEFCSWLSHFLLPRNRHMMVKFQWPSYDLEDVNHVLRKDSCFHCRTSLPVWMAYFWVSYNNSNVFKPL